MNWSTKMTRIFVKCSLAELNNRKTERFQIGLIIF